MKFTRILFLFTFLILNVASASALTFQLDQEIGGNQSLTQVDSYGTISFTQSGNDVLVDVSLTDTSLKLLGFMFNYDDNKFDLADAALFSLVGTTLSVKENEINAGSFLGFDIDVPGNGNLGNVSTFTGLLSHQTKDLFVADFNHLETEDLLYVAAHIGNLGDDGEGSIWVGGNNGTAPVPEPGTVMLLGIGFLGLAVYGKRRKGAC